MLHADFQAPNRSDLPSWRESLPSRSVRLTLRNLKAIEKDECTAAISQIPKSAVGETPRKVVLRHSTRHAVDDATRSRPERGPGPIHAAIRSNERRAGEAELENAYYKLGNYGTGI